MKELLLKRIVDEENLKEALEIRKEVFMKEQGVSLEEEIDEYDVIDESKVIHYLLCENNIPVGTIRIINSPEYIKIGRVAITKNFRLKGYGKFMIENVIKDIDKENIFDIKNKYYYLEAQVQALKFYHSLNFKEYGEIFLDANIEHLKMKREK